MKRLVLVFFFVLVSLGFNLEAASASEEIRLTSYETGIGLGCYGRCGYIAATFKIKNISYQKDVGIYFRLNDGEWHELPAYYVRPLESGFEEWKININVGERGQRIEFVARYEVAGRVYWDNNSFNNYLGNLF